MLVIGLTGGIATGKSSVSALLAPHIPIIDADLLARAAVAPGTRALRAITRAFGPEVLLADGSLDRKKLGSVVFGDEAKRRTLNAIVHPAVRRAMLWAVVKCWMRGERACVLDVPLLIEGPTWKLVGEVVVVHWRLARLQARDASTEEDARARINSQLPIAAKLRYADTLIPNDGTPADLQAEVDKFVARINREAGWFWWRLEWLVPPMGLAAAAWCLGVRALKRWWASAPVQVKKDE
ncbi:hypothetical protein HWV62_37057 [Athelia sp. TMB]|nr:hypothetical protein HWV62_37057 [Athelia sp. TMB]